MYKLADAQIYHSQEPSLGTYLAMRAMPGRKHIVTFRDTRNARDWRMELGLPTLNSIQVMANWLYEDNKVVRRSVRQADGWFAAAHLLVPKARLKYHLPTDPIFLPTPVSVPERVTKASIPTVCFVSRWDRRKRPEIFFELARSFPEVRFLAAGKSRDPAWDRFLREKYSHLHNMQILGFIDQFRSDELSNVLGQSWILVNTAIREGLPNAFIEAAAHGCAILSAVDPDSFASQFGYHAHEDDFAAGLDFLLRENKWKALGDKGYAHIWKVFALDRAIGRHLEIYKHITGSSW
jgi:glycosyltransferase involved in cell wall biosynthesis